MERKGRRRGKKTVYINMGNVFVYALTDGLDLMND